MTFLLLGAAALLLSVRLVDVRAVSPVHFAAVVEAGSEASRIHVFSWEDAISPFPGEFYDLPVLFSKPGWYRAVSPGLHTFAVSGDLSAHLESVLTVFETVLKDEHIPSDTWNSFTVYLRATGAVRGLPASSEKALMQRVRHLVQERFAFRLDARTVTAEEEGLNAFVGVNYLMKETVGAGSPSWGIVDLRGVSSHLVFEPKTVLAIRGQPLLFLGPGWGHNASRDEDATHPFAEAEQYCSAVLSFRDCSTRVGRILDHWQGFHGLWFPPLHPTDRFVALGASPLLHKLLTGSSSTPSLNDIREAAVRVCETDPQNCFLVTWTWTLLAQVYRFPEASHQIWFPEPSPDESQSGFLAASAMGALLREIHTAAIGWGWCLKTTTFLFWSALGIVVFLLLSA